MYKIARDPNIFVKSQNKTALIIQIHCVRGLYYLYPQKSTKTPPILFGRKLNAAIQKGLQKGRHFRKDDFSLQV